MKLTKKVPQKRININLEASLHDQFKAAAAAQGRKMTEVLIEFIEQYVRNERKTSQGE